jgi:hypothetical protein
MKNYMNWKNFVILAALSLPGTQYATPCFAEGGASTGGGTGTTNKDGKPVLLDLAEEEENLEGKLERFDPREQEAYRTEISPRLEKLDQLMPVMKGEAKKKFDDIAKNAEFYFTDKELPNTNDTCMFAKVSTSQAAVQREGKVVVNRDWYKNADSQNRGALLTHEIVMLNNHQPACSDPVRKAVRAFMNPEKLEAKQLALTLFEKGLGLKVPRSAYEKNIEPWVEFRDSRYGYYEDANGNEKYPFAEDGAALLANPKSTNGTCLKIADNQLQTLNKDPEVATAMEDLRRDTHRDFLGIYFRLALDSESISSELYVKTLDAGQANDGRSRYCQYNCTYNELGSISFSSPRDNDREFEAPSEVKHLMGSGGCFVTKEKVLSLLQKFREKFLAPPLAHASVKVEVVKPVAPKEHKADPTALGNCLQDLDLLRKNTNLLHDSLEHYPESWLSQLSMKLTGTASVYPWNRWSLASCQEKKQELQQDLERLTFVKSSVETKFQLNPSAAPAEPFKSQGAE